MSVVAAPDAYGVIENTPLNAAASGGVLANDTNTTGKPLAVAGSTQPAHGTLALATNGSFTYTPAANYSGPDSFSYTASDGSGGTATAAVALTVVPCNPQACLVAGPTLASVNSSQGALTNAVLGSLLGTTVNLPTVDVNGLAQGTVNGSSLVNALQAAIGAGSPSQALASNVTLGQVITAAASAAQAQGNTAEVMALNDLLAQVGPVTGTIQLGSLLQINPNDGSLANATINGLDLVTGAAQLENFNNTAMTPTPVTVSGAALGLGNLVNSVTLQAQVTEPPVFTCGPAGTQFHTAAVRLKSNLTWSTSRSTRRRWAPPFRRRSGRW